MSVSVEHLLHFQQPASPTFSSPPLSPNHLQHAHMPSPSPPFPPPTDVDMSSSASALPAAGQRHDRDDAEMQDGDGSAVGHAYLERNVTVSAESSDSTVAVGNAAVGEDTMDTTPDTDQQLAAPTGTSSQTTTSAVEPPLQSINGVEREEPPSGDQTGSASAADDAVQTGLPSLPIVPPPFFDPDLHPPPPPPPPPPVDLARSDSDSSDDEDDVQSWHPIQEDTSSPDEAELKEIEASSEHSALDHEHWESRAFLPVEEAEYKVGVSGRIDWTIEAYNGTREHPNREIVMNSEPVTIGGHQWQIKFYPKGNDSDYLSVYLECLSVVGQSSNKKEGRVDSLAKDGIDDATSGDVPSGTSVEAAVVEHQFTPLPLLRSSPMPKRKSVAAQVSVVMYNPTEPRVNYSRTALHRFCQGSPDWGWTRFHGPYYDISHRLRGQRQALLRNDKLAFTGYIRIIEDETDCLWEHHSRENPWDSFAMTGLQGLMLGEDASAPGGNMISAIASWMLFKPFRNLLYSAETPDPEGQPFVHPKPLVSALQKVLYMLRTQVEPGAGPVALDDVLDALEWYGIHDRIDKLDVIETWEVLRAKLEEELRDTRVATAFETMTGPKRSHSSDVPSYRVPVVGVTSMQDAIDRAPDFTAPAQDLPQLLTIELARQEFDPKTRSYVKLLNKVSLDDHICLGGEQYTLYGFVVHKQTLQSYVYQPILRPAGPGSRWYSFSDSKDENQVKCLTRKQAVDAHEGRAATDRIDGNDAVAYIVMYIRDDITDLAFETNAQSEQWKVPKWIENDVTKNRNASIADRLHTQPPIEGAASLAEDAGQAPGKEEPAPAEASDFQIIDSRIFLQHEGPGIFEAYELESNAGIAEHVHTIQLSRNDKCDDIRTKIASVIKDVKDPRQIKFWFLDPLKGSHGRPNLASSGKMEYSSGSYDRFMELKEWKFDQSSFACRRIWVHVINLADVSALPEERKPAHTPVDISQSPFVNNIRVPDIEPETDAAMTGVITRSEDTPMGELEEPESESEQVAPEQSRPQMPDYEPPANVQATGEAIVEDLRNEHETIDSHELAPPSVPDDTVMSGTHDDVPPPPPPALTLLPAELVPPPPPPVERAPSPEPPADEIYFFLKFFNPDKQILEARGSFIARKSARVDETLVTCLNLPMDDKKKIEIWEEEELNVLRPIKNRRSFLQVDLHSTSILVVATPRTSDQRNTLAARAAFADPHSFLAYRTFARNFPAHLNGHFTYDYFASEYYKGEIKNGHRHGHGKMFYHSGATYEGTFQLGQRHGHGVYTFQNGDTYDGDWVDNQQHGSGTFVEAATGNTYVGGWKNDKKFGEGVTHWKNAQEEERLCRICWEDAADAAFYDCGHVVACLQCAREVQNCPVCRKRVLCAMKLYYVA